MKKFSISCDFGGQMFPFVIYVGDPKSDHHPVYFQQNWLSKEKGGAIPQEVMDSLEKLKDLAIKNGVSFEELCVYALGAAQEEAVEELEEQSAPEENAEGGAGSETAMPVDEGALEEEPVGENLEGGEDEMTGEATEATEETDAEPPASDTTSTAEPAAKATVEDKKDKPTTDSDKA